MRGGGEETHGGNQYGDGWGFDGADFLELKSGSGYTDIGRWRCSGLLSESDLLPDLCCRSVVKYLLLHVFFLRF